MLTKTSAEAQNQFGQLLDSAQREPVAITRHGRPTAFVISVQYKDEIEALEKARRLRAVTAFEGWLARYGSEGSLTAANLTDEDIVRMVHEARDEAASGR